MGETEMTVITVTKATEEWGFTTEMIRTAKLQFSGADTPADRERTIAYCYRVLATPDVSKEIK